MRFKHWVLVTAMLWYGTVAFFSVGYYHADEHYQIVEFAGLLNGTNAPDDLAWEFDAQIRPATQPVLCFAILSACEFLSVSDPYHQAFILRLITAILTVLIIYFFAHACHTFIADKYWRLFLILSYFLWFLPFLNVRFSSETWSGILLLLATGLLIKEQRKIKHYWLAGVVLGLSFLFRFQIAIAAFGLIMWLVFIRKDKWRRLLQMMVAILCIVAIGIFIDSWFYGEWVVAPYNYFKVNLLENKAASFGTSPWYYYFYYIIRFAIPPIGILMLLSFLILVIRKPFNIFIWIMLPFLVIHCLISHKELRFLFPIALFVPLVIFLAIQEINWHTLNIWVKRLSIVGAIVLGLINFAGVLASGLKPPRAGFIRLREKVTRLHQKQPVNLIFLKYHNPVSASGGLPSNFYKIESIHNTPIANFTKTNADFLQANRQNVLMVQKKYKDKPHFQEFLSQHGFEKIFQSVPEYFVPFIAYRYKRKDVYELYVIKN